MFVYGLHTWSRSQPAAMAINAVGGRRQNWWEWSLVRMQAGHFKDKLSTLLLFYTVL